MKSKASRMPTNANLIHRDIIHNETMKNENRFSDKNRMENFQLNPANMYLLTDKPNHQIPYKGKEEKKEGGTFNQDIFGSHFTDDPVEEAFSNEKLNKILKLTTQVPKQKYTKPMTSNQEIGWFSNQLNVKPQNEKFTFRCQSCEITQFANNYLEMTKTNPFKQR